MSALKVQTIQDASEGNPMAVADLNQGRAKNWVNFDGTGTISTRDSFNLSSLIDQGVGAYTTNFSAPLGNALFAAVLTIGSANGVARSSDTDETRTTAKHRIAGRDFGAGPVDFAVIQHTVFGDAP